MGMIYQAPEQFKRPVYDSTKPYGDYRAACHKYIEDIKAWAKQKNPNDEWAGKIALFPVADGHAQYIVLSLKPLTLIHDDTGDAYEFPYAERLTVRDIKENIKMNESLLQSVFGKPTKENTTKETELVTNTFRKATRSLKSQQPPVNIRLSLSKKQLDNSEGSGGLEITLPDCIGNPQEATPGTAIFLEYYNGHYQVHVWDGTQNDPITIQFKEIKPTKG